MREFMTRVSDYLSERWNDPVRRESRLSIVLIGAVAVVIIVSLLLLLWSYAVQEKNKKEAETSNQEESVRAVSTGEEQAVVYMADEAGQEALRQEYLTSIQYLGEQVEELLQSMTQVQESLADSMEQCGAQDTALAERINEFYLTVSEIVRNLQETQVNLCDFTDIVQILDEEKLPLVQEQIRELRQDMDKAQTDIADVYAHIDELQTEDEKLWAEIGSVQSSLETAMNQNSAEMNDKLDELLAKTETRLDEQLVQVNTQKDELQSRIDRLAVDTLKYRYDEASGTLYLEPGTE